MLCMFFRTKLQHQQALLETIDRERTENSDLKNRLHRIESAYNSYVGSERELVDTNAYLKHHLEQHKADNNKLKVSHLYIYAVEYTQSTYLFY